MKWKSLRLESFQDFLIELDIKPRTVFPRIVSAETILFWKQKMWTYSYSFRIMTIFYFINRIIALEIIERGKLFKGGNIRGNTVCI